MLRNRVLGRLVVVRDGVEIEGVRRASAAQVGARVVAARTASGTALLDSMVRDLGEVLRDTFCRIR